MNVKYNCGIIGQGNLDPPRRRQDLGLAATVRFANELSVPGLVGLSFLRSLVWYLVGITLAEKRRKMERPISASVIVKGIEALAAWHVAQEGEAFAREQTGRIRGSLGQVFRSSTVWRLRHFAAILALMPSSLLSARAKLTNAVLQPEGECGRGAPVTNLSHNASFHS
jgi:hypothetical protein